MADTKQLQSFVLLWGSRNSLFLRRLKGSLTMSVMYLSKELFGVPRRRNILFEVKEIHVCIPSQKPIFPICTYFRLLVQEKGSA